MKKRRESMQEASIKAFHRGSRAAEIEWYDHPVSYEKTFKSKKAYNRSKYKRGEKSWSDDLI